ncbi:MAG: hypothetical protein C5B47_06775 [Verrucomicrobia bacterium]|nr:MAG: hypothetical protein C5B47_06775 [Verrucomicrobiota bacterium]
MKRAGIIAILTLLFLSPMGRAQLTGLGDAPVEITADGETHFEKGVAIADNNVRIHFEDVDIYCDHAEYNPDSRDVLLLGNVRIYSPDGLIAGQRALYNLENKQMRALNFSGSFYPMLFRSISFYSLSRDEFRVRGTYLTTDDSSQPDFHVQAKTMRIYKNDRVIFLYSTLYVGKVPVFWFPYLFSNRSRTGFSLLPGYYSGWGGFVQMTYGIAWGPDAQNLATVHVDYRTERGIALGLDTDLQLGKNPANQGYFFAYWANDTHPRRSINDPNEGLLNLGPTNLPADFEGSNPINTPHNRYRITYQQHLYLADDIYATCDLTKLSDVNMIQDFFPLEVRTNPNPDNNFSFTKWSPNYTLNLLTRFQMNSFQPVVERLPEFAWDIKQQNFFGIPIYFDGSNTLGYLREAFGKELLVRDPSKPGNPTTAADRDNLQYTTRAPNYGATRFDSFSQISFPKTYFGWLSIVPRLGFRATAYSQSGSFYSEPLNNNIPAFGFTPTRIDGRRVALGWLNNPRIAWNTDNTRSTRLTNGGAIFRPVVNFEVESSFKLSHAYERIQSRLVGLDGLMHVVQPYVDYSFVNNFGPKPRDIYQFDTVRPSTEPLPISFPDFQAIDAIDSWSILRTGIRNNLLTRRDNSNYQWLTLDTFFDYNFLNPYNPARIGNLNNYLQFYPSRWLTIYTNFQVPLSKNGFTEFDTAVSVMPCKSLQFTLAHSYLQGYPIDNPFGFIPGTQTAADNGLSSDNRIFANVSQLTLTAYYRLNDNWACSIQEQFDTFQKLWMYQRYYIHRDLSSWIGSLGVEVRRNLNQPYQLSFIALLTLKGAPQVVIPMGIPAQGPMGPGSSR